MMLID